MPPFIKPQELANRWQITRTTVYQMRDRDELDATLIGQSVRFKGDHIAAYESENFVPGSTGPQVLSPDPNRTFYTVKDLAARWDLRDRTIYRRQEKGELGFVRVGYLVRVPSDVVAAIEGA